MSETIGNGIVHFAKLMAADSAEFEKEAQAKAAEVYELLLKAARPVFQHGSEQEVTQICLKSTSAGSRARGQSNCCIFWQFRLVVVYSDVQCWFFEVYLFRSQVASRKL